MPIKPPTFFLVPVVFSMKFWVINLLDSATLLETFLIFSNVVDTLLEVSTIFFLETFNMSVISSTKIFIFSKLLLVFSNIFSLFLTKIGISAILFSNCSLFFFNKEFIFEKTEISFINVTKSNIKNIVSETLRRIFKIKF